MPRLLLLLALIVACGEEPEAETASAPAPAEVAPAPRPAAPEREPAPAPEKKLPVTEDGRRILSDKWYAQYEEGQRSGWIHVVWTSSEHAGRPTVHDRTEMFSVSTRSSLASTERFEARQVIDVERSLTGELVELTVRDIRGDRTLVSTQRWTGDGYDWEQRVAGQVETRRVDCAEPVPTDAESFLSERIRKGEVAPGAILTYPTPDFRKGVLRTVTLAIEEYETLDLSTGPCRCLRVRQTVEGISAETTLWLDGDGVLRKLRSGRSILVSTSPEQARKVSQEGYRFSIVTPAVPHMPRATSLTRAVVEITLAERDLAKAPEFPDSPFSREIESKGNVHVLELLAHDDPEASVELPVTDPDLGPHLESTNLLCADAPEIQAVLKEIIGDEKDGRRVAEMLLRHVFVSLRKGSGPIPEPTAVEILRDGAGDCSEHTVLFVTLCRAAGLPARRVSGYAQVDKVWGSHSWAEVWLGKWVGTDACTIELGTRARYICFGWPDLPDSHPGIVSNRCSGRMSIKTLLFEEGERSWTVADLPAEKGNSDPLSGLTLGELPEGWTAELGPATGTAEIEGPGVTCRVLVMSGWGNLPAEVLSQYFMPIGTYRDFGGIHSVVQEFELTDRTYLTLLVPFRRRCMSLRVSIEGEGDVEEVLGVLAEVLRPTING